MPQVLVPQVSVSKVVLTTAILCLALLATGCTAPESSSYSPSREPDALTDALAGLLASLDLPVSECCPGSTYHHYIAGRSVQGRPLEYYTFGTGADRILIIASIHGDEAAGTSLAFQLGDALLNDPVLLRAHQVIVIPLANPDGVAARTRHNANNVDLNRNFTSGVACEGDGFGPSPFSEPESQFLDRVLREFFPDRIVSIHQPLRCIDYDGPAKPLADHMAPYCPLPINKLGARPCSLGSYAGELLKIPIITLELTEEDSYLTESQRWKKYAPCLLSAITYPNAPKLTK